MNGSLGPRIGDAFGLQLSAAVRHRRPVTAFVERSDGLIVPSGSDQWLNGEQQWPTAIRDALAGLEGPVLDVGAGGGRHGAYLARRSVQVTALDTSELALDICRNNGVPEAVCGDVTEVEHLLRERPPFRTVLLLGNNVGLLGSVGRGKDVLRQLHAVTSADAVIVAEGRRPAVATAENRAYAEHNLARGALPGELVMRLRYGTTATDWFPYLFCGPEDLERIAVAAGWRLRDVRDFRSPEAPIDAPLLSYTAVLCKRGR
ncbi:class I SAM-dependent methyltransferase [Streptomyces pseudovenezuelae]|uniref:class I SAM-dependent methyltransferase n=1 Tax=Streptomyces pseudovenezuelae TaxID=67350 RepID=UPI0034A594DB